MEYAELPSVKKAKEHIRSLMLVLQRCEGSYANSLEDLLNGMDGRYATKENLYRVGELCHAKVLADQFAPGFNSRQWLDEVMSLRADCATAFNELEGTEETHETEV